MMKDKTKEISSEKTTNKYERRLIRKIKLFGSSKDADTLVRMYYDEIYYFVVRQINDRDAAYDLTQEIFISMLRSIGSYREKLASFRTWLYRIAENKVIDFRRRSIRWTVSLDNIYDVDTFVHTMKLPALPVMRLSILLTTEIFFPISNCWQI